MTLKRISIVVAICALASSGHLPVAAQDEGDALPERFLFDGLKSSAPVPVRFDGEPRLRAREKLSSVQLRFVGHWNLVSYETMNADGNLEARDMTGRLLYDGAGNMSAHLYPTGEHEERVTPGYYAYFGKFVIDTDVGFVTHSVEGSNITRWVGTDLVRYYEFSDGKLTLSVRREGRARLVLTWERLR